MMGGIESYLDEELLGKEKPKEPLHLNTTKRNTTKFTNNNKFDQKHWKVIVLVVNFIWLEAMRPLPLNLFEVVPLLINY